MAKNFLIIKTGSTVPSLLARGEDFEDWFVRGADLNADQVLVCAVYLQEKLPDLSAVDAIIITGSPGYVTDLEDWNYVTAEYLRQAHGRQIPLLGVCYGHQLLAWAFGGKVGFHAQGREIGTVAIRLTSGAKDDELFATMPESFLAQVSHQQSVIELPQEAVVLAENDFEPHHAFRVGETSWGLQFHPEFDAEIVAAYLTERENSLLEEGINPAKLRKNLAATPESANLLRVFASLI